ncbi:unnamed protein product [Rotaria magnacalcarata]
MILSASLYASMYNQSCSACQGNRYQTCSSTTNKCQCPGNSYWNGSMCPLKLFENAACGQIDACRSDLNLSCIINSYGEFTQCLIVTIPANANWSQNGVTVAGGNGGGGATNQLFYPFGLFVDDDQTVVIADYWNHRIMQWNNSDTTNGQVVAGGNGQGNGLNQLNQPSDVLIDKETDSLIICDDGNQRVVRWSRGSGTTQGEILIGSIACVGLAIDEQRYLYISNGGNQEVRRYQMGETNGTLVAGGNGQGTGLNQLNGPTYLFVDQDHSVYVSEYWNFRVMKWEKGATAGIVVAGGQVQGSALTQLWGPQGLFVDTLGTLYVADEENCRVMRWTQGANQGTEIVGGNIAGAGVNELNRPMGLSIDRYGNLYVADACNNRVQRFSIK